MRLTPSRSLQSLLDSFGKSFAGFAGSVRGSLQMGAWGHMHWSKVDRKRSSLCKVLAHRYSATSSRENMVDCRYNSVAPWSTTWADSEDRPIYRSVFLHGGWASKTWKGGKRWGNRKVLANSSFLWDPELVCGFHPCLYHRNLSQFGLVRVPLLGVLNGEELGLLCRRGRFSEALPGFSGFHRVWAWVSFGIS